LTGGLYRPGGGNLPRVEIVGLRERLGLKDLTLDLGVVEVDTLGLWRGGLWAMGLVRRDGAGESPGAVVRVTGALIGWCGAGAVVSSVVGQRSHWELLLMLLWMLLRMLSDSDRMELAVLSWLIVLP